MNRIRSFRDLDVWNKAMDLVVEVYALTRGFPSDERYGLTSQMRRAALSVASNIAEGTDGLIDANTRITYRSREDRYRN